MKAVRIHEYGGPEVLVYEEVPRPEPKPNQVLVRVEAASVNQNDIAVRENRFPTPKDPPKIIGTDGAGVVEEAGAEVASVKPGDEVLFSGIGIGSEGSYAEYVVLTEAQAVPKPAGLELRRRRRPRPRLPHRLLRPRQPRRTCRPARRSSSREPPAASVRRRSSSPRRFGARVIGTVAGEREAELVRGLGADETVDYKTQDVVAEVKRLTGDKGADLVHELVISANLGKDIQMIAKGGRIVCTGQGPSPTVEVQIGAALARDATLLFMSTNNAGRAGVTEITRTVAEMMSDGRVKAVVGATLPLREARRAHELLAGDHVGKIVLLPREA